MADDVLGGIVDFGFLVSCDDMVDSFVFCGVFLGFVVRSFGKGHAVVNGNTHHLRRLCQLRHSLVGHDVVGSDVTHLDSFLGFSVSANFGRCRNGVNHFDSVLGMSVHANYCRCGRRHGRLHPLLHRHGRRRLG